MTEARWVLQDALKVGPVSLEEFFDFAVIDYCKDLFCEEEGTTDYSRWEVGVRRAYDEANFIKKYPELIDLETFERYDSTKNYRITSPDDLHKLEAFGDYFFPVLLRYSIDTGDKDFLPGYQVRQVDGVYKFVKAKCQI